VLIPDPPKTASGRSLRPHDHCHSESSAAAPTLWDESHAHRNCHFEGGAAPACLPPRTSAPTEKSTLGPLVIFRRAEDSRDLFHAGRRRAKSSSRAAPRRWSNRKDRARAALGMTPSDAKPERIAGVTRRRGGRGGAEKFSVSPRPPRLPSALCFGGFGIILMPNPGNNRGRVQRNRQQPEGQRNALISVPLAVLRSSVIRFFSRIQYQPFTAGKACGTGRGPASPSGSPPRESRRCRRGPGRSFPSAALPARVSSPGW
jgi:hypothetical protein